LTRSLAVVAFIAALALPVSGCLAPDRPNILLVVADTARADRFVPDPAGGAAPIAPRLAALGREGAVYLAARTPSPWTLPAHASLFTGLYPSSHGAELLGCVQAPCPLHSSSVQGLLSAVQPVPAVTSQVPVPPPVS